MNKAAATNASVLDDEARVDHSLYDEYVRGFDEVPVLNDAVSIPLPRPAPRSFVHGERRSLRGEERPDSYSSREADLTELERLYLEYAAPKPVRRKPTQRARKKGSGRKSKRAASVA